MSINSIKELFEQICNNCLETEKISDVGFNTWLKDLVPLSTDNGVFLLATNNEYKKKTIDLYYKSILEKACFETCGLPMTFEITVKEEEEQRRPVLQGDDAYTFESFIVGASNKFAHAAAMAVAEKPSGNLYNPLFIYGNSGVGKTHLMKAIKNSVLKNFPDKTVLFITGEEFTNELIQAIRNQTTDFFHDRFRSVDVLLIDDIHFIAGKDYAQEEFFNTFNSLYPNHQIVVTSDRSPKEISTLEERIRSRFESGILADMSAPDFETRVGILKNKSEQLGMVVNDDIIYYIAEQLKNNTRQLEGIIKKLHAYATMTNQSDHLTMPLVQSYIRDVIHETLPDPITVERIVTEVSRTYNISIDDIFSKKKSADIAFARQVSIYIVSQMMDMSSTEIGKNFGKDHTTVLYTVEKIKKMLKNNEMEKRLIDDIMKNIKS